MENKPYKPIQCNLYDQLEEWTTFKRQLLLTYADDDGLHVSRSIRIKTLQSRDKVEYLIAEDDSEWRLDDIIAIRVHPLAEN